MDERLKKYVDEVIAPKLQGDGGFIDLTGTDGNVLHVRLQGECSKCAIALYELDRGRNKKRSWDRRHGFCRTEKTVFLGYDLRRKRQWHLYR